MRKNFFELLIPLLLFIVLILIILYSSEVIECILISFNTWKENVFTSLFPFFVVSDLLIKYGFIDLIGELFKNIMSKFFYLPKEASFIIISSMFTGFPSSSKFTKELIDSGKISLSDAQYILSFCHYPNPIFVIGVVGGLLNDKILGAFVLISIILSSFITALIFRRKKFIKKEKINFKECINRIYLNNKNNNFITSFSSSIKKALDTLILLLGIITVFYIICTLIDKVSSLSVLSNSIISGLLEMTQGIKKIALMDISIHLKAIFITGFISFGGLSIHMQTISILNNKEISYLKYFFSRLIHLLISVTIILIILSFIR